MPSPLRFQNIASVFIICIAVVLFLMQVIDYLNFTVDDVFISLRVSENVAHGHGFVYNLGEHVEGYSNWLWVVLLSIPAFVGISQSSSQFALLWCAKGLGLFFGIATLITLFVLAKNIFTSSPRKYLLASITVLFAASCGTFVQWSIGGLETTLCAFLYLFAALQAFHILAETKTPPFRHILFGIALALSCLVRPEPLLHSLIALIYVYKFSGKRFSMRKLSAGIIPFVAIVGIFILWRLSYYGEVVPNTFYAKTASGFGSYILGIKYSFGAIMAIAGPLLIIIPLVFLEKPSRIAIYALLMVSTTFIFALYSGGDWMPGYRFFIPVAAFFFLLGTIGIEKAYRHILEILDSAKHYSAFAIIIAVIACSTAFFGRTLLRGQMPALTTGYTVQKGYMLDARDSVVKWFNDHTAKPFTIVTGEAGYIGYFTPNLRLIDVNGLFDKTIALSIKHHEPVNANYIFGKQPDFILLFAISSHSKGISDTSPASVNLYTLIHDPRFLDQYQEVKTFPNFEIFARKDVAVALQ